jgi:predicted alpha/beta superfamily hydrolase
MTGTDDQLPLAGTEVHYLRSTHVGDEFKIFIGHCGEPSDTVAPSVLYVTDGNGLFASAVDIVRLLQLSAFVPPMLVVGIGYRMGGIAETVAVRTRDFTPTADPNFTRIFPEQTMMGGAPQFLAFIRQELRPWVEARYRVDGADCVYFGHSMGGLFGTYVLLTEPTTFRRYAIGSPSLWWHDDMMFGYESRYAEAHSDLGAKAFFSAGAFEDHNGRQREVERLPPREREKASLRYLDMVADTERMVASLRRHNYPHLRIASAVVPDEFHTTMPPIALSRALRFLYDAP